MTSATPQSAASNDSVELPVLPAARDPRCPLAPPPEFVDWRAAGGLQRARWQDRPIWVASRYTDIRTALVDPRLSADTIRDTMTVKSDDDRGVVIFARIDDPEHNRLRRMMVKEFTFRRVEAMRPQIQQFVDRFLDQMIAAGPPADLVRDFALPVPSLVISLLLGVPYEDHEFFQHHTTLGLDSRASDEVRVGHTGMIFTYIYELMARKEREPGDDLMSRLLHDYVATGQLDRETAVMNCVILLQAGHETTASMLALGTLALLQHPDALEQLRRHDDPAVASRFVEELMRYLSIVHTQVERVATEDLTLGGQAIKAGEKVLMNLPAGNWDPAQFDDPERFDIERDSRGQLGFGYGAHQCIGANLARVELQIALTSLVRRLPELRLAVPADELLFQNTKDIYGIHGLPITW